MIMRWRPRTSPRDTLLPQQYPNYAEPFRIERFSAPAASTVQSGIQVAIAKYSHFAGAPHRQFQPAALRFEKACAGRERNVRRRTCDGVVM